MRKLVLMISFVLVQVWTKAQSQGFQPEVLRANVIGGITSSSFVIDNRSVLYQNAAHTFCATGSGTWSVQVQYADGSSSGPWYSFADVGSLVTNASTSCAGIGTGYHDFVRFSFSGTASVSYAGTKYVWLGGTGSFSASGFLLRANNLSDLLSASTARTNLGLGTAATQNTSFFLQSANNLNDVSSASAARVNIGITQANIAALWTATGTGCGIGTNALLVNGNCGTPTTYPGAGIPQSTGSAWGSSLTLGTTGSDLCCQLSSGLIPASVLPAATSSTLGVVKPDNSTITVSAGVISAVASGTANPGNIISVAYSSSITPTCTGTNPSTAGTLTTFVVGQLTGALTVNNPTSCTTGQSLGFYLLQGSTTYSQTWGSAYSSNSSTLPTVANAYVYFEFKYDGTTWNQTVARAISGISPLTTGQIPSQASTGATVAATAHNIDSPLVCSGTTSCTTSPSFTPSTNDTILYIAGSTVTSLSLAVNGASSATVRQNGSSTVAFTSGQAYLLTFDGTYWNNNGPSGGGGSLPTQEGACGNAGASLPGTPTTNQIYKCTDGAHWGVYDGSAWHWNWGAFSEIGLPSTSGFTNVYYNSSYIQTFGYSGTMVTMNLTSATSSGTSALNAEEFAVPSTPYTYIACGYVAQQFPISNNFQGGWGLSWWNGNTSGAVGIVFAMLGNNGNLNANLLSHQSTYFCLIGGCDAGAWQTSLGGYLAGGNTTPFCIGLDDNGTTKKAAILLGGSVTQAANWVVTASGTHSSGITPAYIGLLVDNQQASPSNLLQVNIFGMKTVASAIF